MSAEQYEILLLVNPRAGKGRASKLQARVKGLMDASGLSYSVSVPSSASELEDEARIAAASGVRIVAVLGGDGTVSAAANGICGTESALAILPAGTADDFAKELGARDLETAVRMLREPRFLEVDMVRLSTGEGERRFINVAGAGFDSDVNETANSMTVRLGATGTYVAAMLKTLTRFQPANYEITVDGETSELSAMLVIVGSGRRYGGGMKVLPGASIVDGLLDVCIVQALSRSAFLRAFPRVFNGSHAEHPKVMMLSGKKVTITADRPIRVYADGERRGPVPASFEIMPAAIRVVSSTDVGLDG